MFKRKKIITLILVVIPIAGLLSQDSAWKKVVIDDNLTVSFPGEVTKLDTSAVNGKTKLHVKIYTCQQESFTMMAIVTSVDNVNKNTASERQKALKEFAKGAMKSYSKKGFTCAVSDTIIRRMNCKKIVCNNAATLFKSFIFLAKNRVYSLQTFFFDNADTSFESLQTNNFLKAVQFEKGIVEAQEFDSLETSTSYKIGYYSLPVIIIAIVVIVFIRKTRAKKSPVNYNG